MLRGWFKIDRDIIKRSIFSDAELLRLYIYLKADATYQEEVKLIDGKPVTLMPGQGTYGRNQLSKVLNVNPSTLYKRLQKLEKLGFVTIKPYKEMSVYTVVDWESEVTATEQIQERKVTTKCQPPGQQIQGLAGFEEYESNNNVNELETNSNTRSNTLKELRNRNINNNNENLIILQPEEQEFLSVLELVPNYPFSRQKDLEMYHTMRQRYPTLNHIEAIKDWQTYKLDKPLKAKDNPRSQINTAFKKYVEWGKCLMSKPKKQPSANYYNDETYEDALARRLAAGADQEN